MAQYIKYELLSTKTLQLSRQERFQVGSKPVVPNSWVAQMVVNSRLLNRQRRRHENQTCFDEHVVQSVDG